MYYLRHAPAGRRFSFLRYFTWNRLVACQRELHRRNWNQVKRWLRRPDGSWRTITADGIALFDPTKVHLERYCIGREGDPQSPPGHDRLNGSILEESPLR